MLCRRGSDRKAHLHMPIEAVEDRDQPVNGKPREVGIMDAGYIRRTGSRSGQHCHHAGFRPDARSDDALQSVPSCPFRAIVKSNRLDSRSYVMEQVIPKDPVKKVWPLMTPAERLAILRRSAPRLDARCRGCDRAFRAGPERG
jgi:hypothetical protein